MKATGSSEGSEAAEAASPRRKRRVWRGVLVGGLAAVAVTFEWRMATRPVVIVMEDTPVGGLFDPETLRVRVGTTVQWRNDGQEAHDATDRLDSASRAGDVAYPSGAKPFDSGSMKPGDTYSYTFTVPGTYKYICIPHEYGGMTGEVIVTE